MWLLDGQVLQAPTAIPTDLYHMFLVMAAMQLHKWFDRILIRVTGSDAGR